MSSIFGRSVIDVLTNKSGGGVIAGDVVILDSANDDSFTTTTTGAYTGAIGVAQETIASNASGRVLISGYAALVNVNASVTRGHYAKTFTVAKQATDAGASRVVGAFAQFTTGGTTPKAILFGMADSTAGGTGANTADTFVTTSTNADLSAQRVRADLKNYHPDAYPASKNAVSDEFDDGSLDGAWGWTAAGTPASVSESTYSGFLLIDSGTDASGTSYYLRRAYAPGATAFTVAAKVSMANAVGNFSGGFGIALLDSGDAVIWSVFVAGDGSSTAAKASRIITTPTTVTLQSALAEPRYLLIQRSAANVYKGYFSVDGITWTFVGTSTVATTVAKVALAYGSDTDSTEPEGLIDFIRVFDSATKVIGS